MKGNLWMEIRSEKKKVSVEAIGKCGYVANSPHTVLYRRREDNAKEK